MSKTTTTNSGIISTIVKRFAVAATILMMAFAMNTNAQIMCGPSFTYTVGASGQVSFTGSSVGTGTNCTYSWSWWGNGGYGTINQQSPVITFPYNGSYYVTLTTSDSTSSCGGSVSDTIVITNSQACQGSFTYTLGANGQVDFTNTSAGSTTYYWDFGDNSSSSVFSPSHTYTYNGTYQVTLYGDTTGGGCWTYTTQTITVTTGVSCGLVAGFTYTLGSNGLVNFTNTSTGTSGSTVYSWSFGDNNYSSLASPSNMYLYNGTYVVQLYVSDSNSVCSSSITDSIVITNSTPTPTCNASFTYTTGSNGFVSFTNTSTGNVNIPYYEWNFGDGNSTTAPYNSFVNHTYLYNGTYNVTLTEYDSVTMNANCTITQAITITNAASNPSCGDSAYFFMYPDSNAVSTWNVYLTTALGSTVTNATWYWGDGSTSTGLYPSHTYASAGWYTICVQAYFACGDSSYFCQSDSLYRSSSSMVTVNVVNSATGIKNVTNNITSLKLYPNPFTDYLTMEIGSGSYTYTMTDVYGKQILSEKISASAGDNKLNVNTSNVGSGVYFITVVDNTTHATKTIKVVK